MISVVEKVAEVETFDDVPEGWVIVPFLDVIDYEGGSQPPKKKFVYEPKRGYVRLLQIRDFGDKPFPTYVPDSTRLKKTNADDLLLARYGGGAGDDCLGRICTGLAGAYNVALVKLKFPRQFIDAGFVKCFFLGSWFKEAISVNSRSCQQGFNRDDLKLLTFSLAPLAEQKRIAKKVEVLLARVNAARERLKKVSIFLKRFRQTVLAAACAGRLTKDWHVLPDSIEEGELPSTWKLIDAGEAYTDARYGTSMKCDKNQKKGIPVLRVPNIAAGTINLSDLKYASFTKKELVSYAVREGDIVICRTNGSLDLIGKAAVIPKLDREYTFASYLIRVRVDGAVLLPRYFHCFLSGPLGRDIIEEQARSTAGQFNLNLEILRSLPIPLPPLGEQHEIIRRVEELFKLAGAIEKRVTAAMVRTNKLTQSILAKAFRGELVPTEAELARREGRTYETASVLLARISDERYARKETKTKMAPIAKKKQRTPVNAMR